MLKFEHEMAKCTRLTHLLHSRLTSLGNLLPLKQLGVRMQNLHLTNKVYHWYNLAQAGYQKFAPKTKAPKCKT